MSEAILAWRKPAGSWRISHCLPLGAVPPRSRWQKIWRGLRQSFRLMVGVHDYQNYLQHMRLHHPDQTPMNEREFYRYCLDARFPSQPGKLGKCPC